MKKTRLFTIPQDFPQEFREFVGQSDLYDSSSSPEARVYFIDRGDGFYLKQSSKGSLKLEAEMTGYFHSKGLGAEVVSYVSDVYDWLLTAAVSGEDAVHPRYLEKPERLSEVLGQELRCLHELDVDGCPVMHRTDDFLDLAERNYRLGHFNSALFEASLSFSSAEEAYKVLQEGKDMLQSRVLLHGDYCLPNVMLENWQLTGFIDVGTGGIGDRHIDLFWGIWTLNFNLQTNEYADRFLDAYGRDVLNPELFSVVAAAEVFG